MRLVASIVVLAIASCGSAERADGGLGMDAAEDGATERDAATDASRRDAGDAGADDAGADAGSAATPTCSEACTSAADCASASATTDENNWTCAAGRCHYEGCHDDDECQSTFGASGGTWVCGPGPVALCVATCAVALDCASASATADEDNWTCTAGRCHYEGCRGDAECQSTFGASGGTWTCGPGVPPLCVESCASPDDCASGAATVDADNWTCVSGSCRYEGCRDDAECQSTFGASGGTWVCG